MRETLCCCEYWDNNGERNHILACCCNCVELDLCFDRLITCNRIPRRTFIKIMATIGDRLRFPWKNGAIKVSFDSLLPLVLLPFTLLSAAQGVWMSVVTFTFLPISLMYSHFFYMKCRSTSNFFLVWAMTSIAIMVLVLETVGVYLLDIRYDENLIFLFLTGLTLWCFYKVKQKSSCTVVSVLSAYEHDSSSMCSVCNMKVPERAFHCYLCNSCILMRDQHCAWLNCCIGKGNHRWYMLLLAVSILQMILFSDLVLTTACHPFTIVQAGIEIMLPDDCSDVYFEFYYTIGFVTAIYCLEAVVFLTSLLLHEFCLISLGMTGHEWRNSSSHVRCLGLNCCSPYSKGIFQNWYYYFKGVDNPTASLNSI